MSAIAMPGGKQKRGFAVMDPERRREIASLAGKKSQAGGRANRFKSKAEARAAGKKGGMRSGVVRSKKKAERERGAAPPGVQDPKGAADGSPPLVTDSGTVAKDPAKRDVP